MRSHWLRIHFCIALSRMCTRTLVPDFEPQPPKASKNPANRARKSKSVQTLHPESPHYPVLRRSPKRKAHSLVISV